MTRAAKPRQLPAPPTPKGPPAKGLQIEWVPIASVRPYANNPRRGAAVEKVAASLRAFGWRQPLVVDAERVLIVGHTRLRAAQSLGMTEVPIHVAAELTVAQAAAYRLADNRSAQDAEWDPALLAGELAGLEAEAFDLGVTGFDPAELDNLLGRIAPLGDDAFGALPDGAKPPFEQMTFVLHVSQAVRVRRAIAAAKARGDASEAVNENSNGNALTRVVDAALAAWGEPDE